MFLTTLLKCAVTVDVAEENHIVLMEGVEGSWHPQSLVISREDCDELFIRMREKEPELEQIIHTIMDSNRSSFERVQSFFENNENVRRRYWELTVPEEERESSTLADQSTCMEGTSIESSQGAEEVCGIKLEAAEPEIPYAEASESATEEKQENAQGSANETKTCTDEPKDIAAHAENSKDEETVCKEVVADVTDTYDDNAESEKDVILDTEEEKVTEFYDPLAGSAYVAGSVHSVGFEPQQVEETVEESNTAEDSYDPLCGVHLLTESRSAPAMGTSIASLGAYGVEDNPVTVDPSAEDDLFSDELPAAPSVENDMFPPQHQEENVEVKHYDEEPDLADILGVANIVTTVNGDSDTSSEMSRNSEDNNVDEEKTSVTTEGVTADDEEDYAISSLLQKAKEGAHLPPEFDDELKDCGAAFARMYSSYDEVLDVYPVSRVLSVNDMDIEDLLQSINRPAFAYDVEFTEEDFADKGSFLRSIERAYYLAAYTIKRKDVRTATAVASVFSDIIYVR